MDSFDHDKRLTFGNPWHGALQGTTLVTESGVSTSTAYPALTPDTHLVEFTGLPEFTTPDADLALGLKWKNYAILIGNTRRYSPKAAIAFGNSKHIYLTADKTHYHITVTGTTISGSISSGTAYNQPILIRAAKASGSGLETSSTLINTTLSVTAKGDGSGCYTQASTFSPDGKKLAISIHKYASAAFAGERNLRRSLGVVGVWEIVLSGGSASAPPSAVITQIKTSDQCYIDEQTAGTTVDEFGAITVSGLSFSLPSPYDPDGDPLPAGQNRQFGWKEYLVTFGQRDIGRTYTKEVVIGAAYDSSNALQVFTYEAHGIEDYSASYSGPSAGPIDRRSYDVVLDDGNHVVSWYVFPGGDIDYAYNYHFTLTTTFKLKVGAIEVLGGTMIWTHDQTGEGGLCSEEAGVFAMEKAGSSSTSSISTFGGSTFIGYIYPQNYMRGQMTSNNTAALFQSSDTTYAFGWVAPSGSVGAAQTITFDSAGLPWASWNPKTNALATTPGYSWC